MNVDGLFAENWLLTFVRVLAMLMVAPVLSTRSVPTTAKVGLGALVAYALTLARATNLTPLSGELGPFIIAIGQEMLVGLLIGFAAALVFTAFTIAGEAINLQLGLGLGPLLNPGMPLQGAAIGQFYTMLATLLFLVINGHHILLLSLKRTLDTVPPGTFIMTERTAEALIRISATTIQAGIHLALPVMGAVLLTEVAFGLVNRTVPMMPVFLLGLPIKILVGLGMALLALPVTLRTATKLLGEGMQSGILLFGR